MGMFSKSSVLKWSHTLERAEGAERLKVSFGIAYIRAETITHVNELLFLKCCISSL